MSCDNCRGGFPMSTILHALSTTRQSILVWVKTSGGTTTAEVASRLGITDEGARQHLVFLENRGWIERGFDSRSPGRSGRWPRSSTVRLRHGNRVWRDCPSKNERRR